VLIIDDQLPFSYLARRVVARQGLVVATADSAPSGIDLARRFRPSLVLCDLILGPDGDGFDVARALRDDPATRQATLIAVSGSCSPDHQAQAEAAGFDLFLTKPVDLGDLPSLLRRAGRG
jgi:CheY-like chemotaxis protein